MLGLVAVAETTAVVSLLLCKFLIHPFETGHNQFHQTLLEIRLEIVKSKADMLQRKTAILNSSAFIPIVQVLQRHAPRSEYRGYAPCRSTEGFMLCAGGDCPELVMSSNES